jgi:exonuclease III
MAGVVSWNIGGLRKLARHPGVFAWLRAQKVILLQETLQVSSTFNFPGFARIEVPAIDVRGKASGGLLILLAKDWLGNGHVHVLYESASLLLLRITWDNVGLLVGNVYIPIQSENCPADIYASTAAKIESVAASYPGDGVIFGKGP